MSTDTLPTPTAARLRRPSWRDPRLVIGVVLVALSVALGSWVVSHASQTTAVWAAAEDLTPGEALTGTVLRVTEVRLVSGGGNYLSADEPLPAGLVVTRVVGEGELVPRSAIGIASDLDLRSVAVPTAGSLPDRLHQGSTVDVWFVPSVRSADDAAPAPRLVVAGVVVEQIAQSSGLIAGSGTTLHLLIPGADLPAVLAALGDDGTITVVPIAGTISG